MLVSAPIMEVLLVSKKEPMPIQEVALDCDAIDDYFECITACSLGDEGMTCITQCVEVHLKREQGQ